MARTLQRKFEAAIGGRLIKFASKTFLKQSQMVKKEATLKDGLVIHYYEYWKGSKNAAIDNRTTTAPSSSPTLLIFHGITDEAKNLAPIVTMLRTKFPNWRILVPDLPGHGHDMDRLKHQVGGGGDSVVSTANNNLELYPTAHRLLEIMQDFTRATHVESSSVLLGMSLGGALAYYLQHAEPTTFPKSILINPAFHHVLDDQFIEDFKTGRKNHFCVESREDVKTFFRDLSSGEHRIKKDPIPKFFLEAIWRDRQSREPPQHFRTLFTRMLEERDPEGVVYLGSSVDLEPEARRLVIWPENDFITNHAKGKEFFAHSPNTIFRSVPDCGHLFHSNGKTILEIAEPWIVAFLQDEGMPKDEHK